MTIVDMTDNQFDLTGVPGQVRLCLPICLCVFLHVPCRFGRSLIQDMRLQSGHLKQFTRFSILQDMHSIGVYGLSGVLLQLIYRAAWLYALIGTSSTDRKRRHGWSA